ncbi:MAG TPA: cation:proton antiporter [Oscillatoriales cyanobacterium M59_W2019_021]|nr:cation:proton antiporter [Oscillatoriales cyanobacterium M59_W2019_021]
MAADSKFILDLTTVLGTSAVGGYLANRLRQPVLLGYLASGLIVGPYGLKWLSDVETVNALAAIGVAFLLFALGVEFSIAELKRVKDIALKGSLLQIGGTIGLVALCSSILGWVESIPQAIFLGAILSLSSTAVVLKTLTERGETNTLHGQVMLAILIVQDLALGLMLAILPALSEPENLLFSLFAAILKATVFFSFAFALGKWVIPGLIRNIAQTESGELFLLSTIALCLGVALITAKLGLSIEMGAFVAGLMISEIDYADQALSKILPLRDTFASVFFASIGMLIDPQALLENFGTILGLVVMVMLGKAIVILPIVLKFGYSFKTAVIASLGLNQIGEFSFVLALVAQKAGFLTQEKYLLLLGTTAITLVLTPIGLKWSPKIADWLGQQPLLSGYLNRFRSVQEISVPETLRDRVVVAGYGRVGQVVVNILRDRGYPVLVIENSEAAIKKLRQEGIPYIFGDGDSELVLEKAHLELAKALAIALPDPASTRLLLKRALEFAPQLDVVARSHENSEIDLLTQLGAWEVVQPEFEAALEMGAHMLATLGENPDAIGEMVQTLRKNRYSRVRSDAIVEVRPKDLTEITQELNNEWIAIKSTSPLIDKTLAEADIRNLTGVTVMAIRRGDSVRYYPSATTQLQADDTVLVVGEPEEIAAFHDLTSGRCVIGEGYNRWMTLTEESPLVGLQRGDLESEYDVILQALRRQGKLYRQVEESVKFLAEDCLLLSGIRDRVEGVEKLAQH